MIDINKFCAEYFTKYPAFNGIFHGLYEQGFEDGKKYCIKKLYECEINPDRKLLWEQLLKSYEKDSENK